MTTTETKPTAETTIQFIRMYRDMEKLSYEAAFALIKKMLGSKFHTSTLNHLCDHWKGKKKDFSDWYLNLSTDSQILILNYFGITDPKDESYKEKIQTDSKAILFVDPPSTARALRNTLIFFYNNGIGEYTFERWGIVYDGLKFPETTKKAYGNGTNWGEFILQNSLLNPESVKPVLKFAMSYK